MFDFLYDLFQRVGYTHPLHPPLTHMPSGLVVAATVFGWAALASGRRTLYASARHCATLALLFAVPAILLGYADWQRYYGGALLWPIKMKLGLATVLFVLLCLAAVLGWRRDTPTRGLLATYTAAFFMVVGLGYFGGQLVFGGATPPATQETAAGGKIFEARCSGCHPNGGNVIRPNLPLRRAPQLASEDTFRRFLRDPRLPDGSQGPMPVFSPQTISDQDVQALYQYVQQLAQPSRK